MKLPLNWYAYVGNDPINMVDPDGRRGLLRAFAKRFAMFEERVRAAKLEAKDKAKKLNKEQGARTEPKDLKEKLSLDEAKDGAGEKMDMKLKDKKYNPETGTHEKMKYNKNHGDGTSTEIHYDKNKETKELSGFKIKDDTNAASRGNVELTLDDFYKFDPFKFIE